jgi:hypothetical protein
MLHGDMLQLVLLLVLVPTLRALQRFEEDWNEVSVHCDSALDHDFHVFCWTCCYFYT